jgi:predicted PhzF superfamily epimerase YddE/YHI9
VCFLSPSTRPRAGRSRSVRIAQGAETGRPSEIAIELRGDEVVLRGEAVVVAGGTLHLPAG